MAEVAAVHISVYVSKYVCVRAHKRGHAQQDGARSRQRLLVVLGIVEARQRIDCTQNGGGRGSSDRDAPWWPTTPCPYMERLSSARPTGGWTGAIGVGRSAAGPLTRTIDDEGQDTEDGPPVAYRRPAVRRVH